MNVLVHVSGATNNDVYVKEITMQESDGFSYKAAKYEKGTYLAPGKVGKTCFLVASALGVLPNQMKRGSGGIVGSPSKLHIIAIDSSAMTDVVSFMTDILKAPKEVAKINIYNMQDDVNRLAASDQDYDLGFYNSFLLTLARVQEKVAQSPGTHGLIISSLTGLASAIERGVAGPPGSAGTTNKDGQVSGKGYMDPSKWKVHAQQLSHIRMKTQVDDYHCLWEGHIDVTKKFSMSKEDDAVTETIAISGQSGRNWPYNTDHTFRMRREFNNNWEGTECDKVHLCKPDMDFTAGGRGYTGRLRDKEYDLTHVYQRLGLKVGGWGRNEKKLKAAKK